MAKKRRVPLDRRTLEIFRELGRQGGHIGGRVRAANLTAHRRQEIARKAAAARWGSVSSGKKRK